MDTADTEREVKYINFEINYKSDPRRTDRFQTESECSARSNNFLPDHRLARIIQESIVYAYKNETSSIAASKEISQLSQAVVEIVDRLLMSSTRLHPHP